MPKDKLTTIVQADLGQKRDGTRVLCRNAEGTFAPQAKVAPALSASSHLRPQNLTPAEPVLGTEEPQEIDHEAAAQLRRASEPVPVETEKLRALPAFTRESKKGSTRIVK